MGQPEVSAGADSLMRIVTAFIAALIASPASAAVCMNAKTLTGYLADRFKEQPVAAGLVEGRNFMEVHVSAKGTWTIVMTNTQGVSCIVAAGDEWQAVKPDLMPDPDKGDPT